MRQDSRDKERQGDFRRCGRKGGFRKGEEMKRNILFIGLTALACAFVLSACSPSAETNGSDAADGEKKYRIEYDLAGGRVSGKNPDSYTSDTETFALVSPEKEGYRFIGWTGTDYAEPVKDVQIPKGSSGDKRFTAHYIRCYTVRFDLSCVVSGVVKYVSVPGLSVFSEGEGSNERHSVPAMVADTGTRLDFLSDGKVIYDPADEYEFAGWYIGETAVNAETVVSEELCGEETEFVIRASVKKTVKELPSISY